MERTVTLREVIAAVAEFANTENEILATVAHLVNSGRVRLQGDLAGAHIDLVSSRIPALQLTSA